ncbi:protein Gawky-like isoform X2 [Phlebotomus papatasi]|uniref:protein Gawky-like isoform X2 n=1 Tax=Phlebotomus papatasi TaxID=29031 RepID=UPI0024838F68|nr:protein Gawky-like isoform X2 [Phlebotomus papatasi]XP_055712614.1 protein Gawky-like isoform X2 [Phlebotomus papatasi]
MMAGKDDKMERSDIETIANVDHSHSVKDYFRYDEFLQSTGGQAVSGWGSPAKGATWGDNTAGGGGGGGGGGVGGSDQMAKTTSNAAPEDNCNEDGGAWGTTSTLNLGIVKPPSQFDWPPPPSGGNNGANNNNNVVVVGASKVVPKGGEISGGIVDGGGQASDNPNGSVNLNQVVKQQQQQQQEPSTGESEAAAVPVAPANAAKNQLNQLRDALYAYEGWGKDHVNQETQWEVALSPTKSLEVSGGVEAPTGTELWHLTKSGKTVVQQTGGEGEERGTTMWGHVPSSNFGGTWGDNSEIDEGGGSSVWPTTPSMPTREFQWGIVEGIPAVNKAPGAAVIPPPSAAAAPSVIEPDTPGALGGGNIWSTGPGIPGAAAVPGGGAWNDSRAADSMIRGGVTGRLNLMDNNPSKVPGWGDDPLVQLPPTQPSTSFWSQHQPPQAVQAAPQPTTGAVSWNHDIPDVSGVRSRLAPGPMQPPPNLPDRFPPGKPDTNPWGHQGITKNGLWDQIDRPTPESSSQAAAGGLWGKSGGNKGGGGGGGVWADPGDYRNWTPNGQATHFTNAPPNGMNKFAIGSGGNRMGGTNKVQEIIRSSKQFRLMSTMGYKADDIETALQMTNMNMNEAVELLNQSQRAMGKFGGGVGVVGGGGEDFCEPGRALSGRFPPPPPPSHPQQQQQQQTTGTINGSGLDNAQQLLPIQKYLNQASNNPLVSSSQGAAGGGINLNQLQAANQTTEPSIHQLRGLVQQIEMAVQAGYLNQQILNQPLSPQTVQLLSQLLNTIKHLPAPQNQISSQPSVFNKQQSVADFQRAQQQFDPLGSLQGNFSDLALSKQNPKLPFVQAQATTQVQSRLNQWKLPPSVNPDNDMANFSRAPGTSTKPPNLTMNFSMNYEGPWSSEPNNASDGWPDIPEFEPGKPWKGPQIKTMEDDEM